MGDEVRRFDAAELRLDEAEPTPEGWLRVPAAIGRGDVVLPYRNPDGSLRWEFRPASEVFDAEAMASFEGVPLTNDHPPRHLDSETAKHYTMGTVATPRREGNLLVANVLVTDSRMIADVRAGKRQLSPGYRIEYDPTPGVFKGRRYDGVQRRPRGNHVAGVQRGRQGPEVSLRMDSGDAVLALLTDEEKAAMGDENNNKDDKGESKRTTRQTTVKVDGRDLEVDETTAAVLADMEKKRLDTEKKLAALMTKVDALTQGEPAPKPKDASMPGPSATSQTELQAQAQTQTQPKTDADLAARLDALEAKHKADAEAAETKHRADMAALQARLDAVADARAVIGPDYEAERTDGEQAVSKTRADVLLDIIEEGLGKDARAKVEGRKDSPGFEGYLEAFREQAMAAIKGRKDHARHLLRATKTTGRVGERADAVADAQKKAAERKENAWRGNTSTSTSTAA